MLANYLPVLIFLGVATGLAVVLLSLGNLFGRLGARHTGSAIGRVSLQRILPFYPRRPGIHRPLPFV